MPTSKSQTPNILTPNRPHALAQLFYCFSPAEVLESQLDWSHQLQLVDVHSKYKKANTLKLILDIVTAWHVSQTLYVVSSTSANFVTHFAPLFSENLINYPTPQILNIQNIQLFLYTCLALLCLLPGEVVESKTSNQGCSSKGRGPEAKWTMLPVKAKEIQMPKWKETQLMWPKVTNHQLKIIVTNLGLQCWMPSSLQYTTVEHPDTLF